MLNVYRSNRSEWLAKVLAEQLRVKPPEAFEKIDVVVNTWPTSRWLSEQIAVVNGVNALVSFPFPGSYLKQILKKILGNNVSYSDPWDAKQLIWQILDLLPNLIKEEEAKALGNWLSQYPYEEGVLTKSEWQLARSISKTFDDYVMYRIETIINWLEARDESLVENQYIPRDSEWQIKLIRLLSKKIEVNPFGMQVKEAIALLKEGIEPKQKIPSELFFFGITSLAPLQIELIQAISGITNVNIFLLTPCPDLWQHCTSRREELGINWKDPIEGSWLYKSHKLEAHLGRMGAEFQQLLEGSGESQLGECNEHNLFASPINIAKESGREPTLLEQLQEQLVTSNNEQLRLGEDDTSLTFLPCPNKKRQVELIRDQIIQWLSIDKTLNPRDILIMTPQVKEFSPLIASIFSDKDATNVELPWKITDRSQQENPGIIKLTLELLDLASNRFTLSSLKSLLTNPALQEQKRLTQEECLNIIELLQETGFTWGIDATDKNGNETHTLSWCLDRWLLGLSLTSTPGLAPGGIAPFNDKIKTEQVLRWWPLLSEICSILTKLRNKHKCREWIELIKFSINQLFGDCGTWVWEKQSLLDALESWKEAAHNYTSDINVDVVYEILNEAFSKETGRIGHRSGKVTISALEPMRAIPHKIIILMGIDSEVFPRSEYRPSFNLLEQKCYLGDPSICKQDRYSVLEAIMSARKHLMITWNNKNELSGEFIPPASPIQIWLGQLADELDSAQLKKVIREPPTNPLDRNNFLTNGNLYPPSCDRRNLEARKWLDKQHSSKPLGLALPLKWNYLHKETSADITNEKIRSWLKSPQLVWLEQLKIKPGEWFNPLEDLDKVELKEFQRKNIMKSNLNDFVACLNESQSGTLRPISTAEWKNNYAGQGIFPSKAAGEIEYKILRNRWESLRNTLGNIGDLMKKEIMSENHIEEILFAGESPITIELGKLNSKAVMMAWLTHLNASININQPIRSFLITRKASNQKKEEFEISLCFKEINSLTAQELLVQLKQISYFGLTECWPIPPESGWAFAKAAIQGNNKTVESFQSVWEGGYKHKGERERSEMQLCFGNCSTLEITRSESFKNAFSLLYDPIISCVGKIRING